MLQGCGGLGVLAGAKWEGGEEGSANCLILHVGAWVDESSVRQRQPTSEGRGCGFTPERRKSPKTTRGKRGISACGPTAKRGCPDESSVPEEGEYSSEPMKSKNQIDIGSDVSLTQWVFDGWMSVRVAPSVQWQVKSYNDERRGTDVLKLPCMITRCATPVPHNVIASRATQRDCVVSATLAQLRPAQTTTSS